MASILHSLNVREAEAVIDALRRGAEANMRAACRRGSIDVIGPIAAGHGHEGTLIATGDLHDNPTHMQRVFELAGIADTDDVHAGHVTLHELIHPDELPEEGLDFSYKALARAALAKATFPERVHTLLANHELSQISGAGIVKGGVNVVKAFNDGVARVFGARAEAVTGAINGFVRSMPLALRCIGAGAEGRDLLCAHSLPGPDLLERFDPAILERDLTEEDYVPRRGSAHLMVWGRAPDATVVNSLAERWGVGTFILGHEKAPMGVLAVGERAVVLNTDHDRAAYVEIDLAARTTAAQVVAGARALAG